MPRSHRLTKAQDFAAVRREGRRWSDRFVVLLARPNQLEFTRAGFQVSSRIGNAVTRNRVKRRLREAVRLSGVREGWDLVLVARRDAAASDFKALSRSVTNLLGRAGLVATAAPGLSHSHSTD